MVESEQQKLPVSDLWSKKAVKEKVILPFFSWINDENDESVCILKVTKPIKEYAVTEINGQFGISSFIAIECNEILSLFRIDSKRLRSSILTALEKVKTFPVKLQIVRTGAKFSTAYTSEII